MELKKLIEAYLKEATPLESVSFSEDEETVEQATDKNSISLVTMMLMKVSVEWKGGFKKDFAFPISISQIEVVEMLQNVSMGYYFAQLHGYSQKFVAENKLQDMPSLVVPNNLSIIN